MLDFLLYVLAGVSIFAFVVFVLPIMVYICVRAGTAGYLITKQKFLELKKDECDECKRSESRKNVSRPEKGGTA